MKERKGNTTVLHVSIPTDLYKDLKEASLEEHRSLSNYVGVLLKNAFKERVEYELQFIEKD